MARDETTVKRELGDIDLEIAALESKRGDLEKELSRLLNTVFVVVYNPVQDDDRIHELHLDNNSLESDDYDVEFSAEYMGVKFRAPGTDKELLTIMTGDMGVVEHWFVGVAKRKIDAERWTDNMRAAFAHIQGKSWEE